MGILIALIPFIIIAITNSNKKPMETIEIKKENVLKAYKKANQTGKDLLENLFGKNVIQAKITDRIKTIDDACNELGINTSIFENMADIDGVEDSGSIDFLKATIITKALNEGWKPNWEDTSEYKWFPWFKMKSGFGFSGSDCTYAYSNTHVGSRLCFKSEELATYAGKQFESIYKNYLTL